MCRRTRVKRLKRNPRNINVVFLSARDDARGMKYARIFPLFNGRSSSCCSPSQLLRERRRRKISFSFISSFLPSFRWLILSNICIHMCVVRPFVRLSMPASRRRFSLRIGRRLRTFLPHLELELAKKGSSKLRSLVIAV